MYISTYDSHSYKIRSLIKKSWHILQSDTKYGCLFREPPRFVYRKGKTIGNYLIHLNKDKKELSKKGAHLPA